MTRVSVEDEISKYWVALEAFPEFSAKVGVLISCFAQIESYIHRLIGRISNISEPDAFLIAGRFSSVRARVELLEALAAEQSHDPQMACAIERFAASIKRAIDLRNTYAHGSYGLTYEGGRASPTAKKIMRIQSFAQDSRRKKPRVIERDMAGIEADLLEFKRTICELHAFLYRNELPESCAKEA